MFCDTLDLSVAGAVPMLRCSVRASGRNAHLIRFLILALYIYCCLDYIVCFPTHPFFFTFSLLISSVACLNKRRLNLALVFYVFILCYSTFLLIGECVLLLW